MELRKVEVKVLTGNHSIKKSNFEYFEVGKARIYSRDFKLIHKAANTNDIQSIWFYGSNLLEFPRAQILLDLVKNLTSLYITECNLPQISGNDLRGLGTLKELWLNFNSIETLPKGLFEHSPNLEIVSFWHNRIKEIDENILDPLENLKYFDLSDNLRINVWFDSINNEGNVTLEQFKAEIKKCRPSEEIVNDLKRENDDFKEKNAGLMKEVETLKKNHETIRKDFAKMRTDITKMKTENVQIKLENQNLRMCNQLLRKEITKTKKEVTDIKTNCVKLTAELEQLKSTNAKLLDFTIVVNGKNFRVNKNALIANSPVLAKLIGGNHDADRLVLRDVSEETFEEILNFMMTKNPPKEAVDLIELYAASARLEMKDLMELTAEILIEKVTPENALRIFMVCEKFNHKQLSKKALSELNKKFAEN